MPFTESHTVDIGDMRAMKKMEINQMFTCKSAYIYILVQTTSHFTEEGFWLFTEKKELLPISCTTKGELNWKKGTLIAELEIAFILVKHCTVKWL